MLLKRSPQFRLGYCVCCDEEIPIKNKHGTIGRFVYGHSNRGSYNGSWKGGKRKHSEGYIEIKRADHPNCNSGGYVFEHRLVMEEYLGRYLTDEEVVHHLNGIKTDNRIENLELLASQSTHLAGHMKKDMSDRICFACGSNETRYHKRTGYKNWHRHPITKAEWLCAKCYETVRRKLGLKKLYPARVSPLAAGMLR